MELNVIRVISLVWHLSFIMSSLLLTSDVVFFQHLQQAIGEIVLRTEGKKLDPLAFLIDFLLLADKVKHEKD